MRLIDRILQEALRAYFPPGPFARLLNNAEAQGFDLLAPADFEVRWGEVRSWSAW